jgi:hypothetical protein
MFQQPNQLKAEVVAKIHFRLCSSVLHLKAPKQISECV